jgi:DNA-binding MarR family transcriptional regulator
MPDQAWTLATMARYADGMTTPTDDQLARLGAAFETFARRHKLLDALGSETQLNELDKQTLLYVADHPGCGPTDVARFLAVPNTTISSSTDRLVKRGLLERHRPEADRRAVALRLSAGGKAYADAILTAHRDLYRRMLGPLSPAERRSFIRMITKIVNHED